MLPGLPRRAHGAAHRADRRGRPRREVEAWNGASRARAAPADAAADAGDHPPRRLRARPRASASTRCATRLARLRRVRRQADHPARPAAGVARSRRSTGSARWRASSTCRDGDRRAAVRADRRAPRRARRARRRALDAARGAPRGRLADVRAGAARRAPHAADRRARDHRDHARLGVRAARRASPRCSAGWSTRSTPATATSTSRRRSSETLRRRPVLPNNAPRLVAKPIEVGGWHYEPGVCLVAERLPASTTTPTSTRTRTRSGPSASSTSRPAPTPGSRSAAGAGAASAPASPLLEMQIVLARRAARLRAARRSPAGPSSPGGATSPSARAAARPSAVGAREARVPVARVILRPWPRCGDADEGSSADAC